MWSKIGLGLMNTTRKLLQDMRTKVRLERMNMNKIMRIDDLGRVVIPKEIRRILGISEGDPLEVNVNTKTGQIIIEKYEVEPDKRCNWCGSYIVGEYENGVDEGVYYHPICYKKATSESYHL